MSIVCKPRYRVHTQRTNHAASKPLQGNRPHSAPRHGTHCKLALSRLALFLPLTHCVCNALDTDTDQPTAGNSLESLSKGSHPHPPSYTCSHLLVPHSARCPCAPLAHDLSLLCLLLRLLATVLPRPCRRPPGTARLRLDAPAPVPLTRVMSHLPVRSVPLLQHQGTPLQV